MQYINLSDIKKKLQDDEMMEREKYISILREELSRAESMEQIFETFTVSSPYIKSHPESPLYIEFLFFQGDVETQLLGGVNIVRNTAKLRINCSENTSHVEFSVDNGPKKKLKLIKHPQNAKIKLAELQFKDYSDSISGTNIVELKIESGKTQISHPICFYQNDNQISKLYYKMFNHFLSKNPLDVAIKTFHRNQLGVGLHEESMRYLLEVGKDKLCHWFPEVILMLNKLRSKWLKKKKNIVHINKILKSVWFFDQNSAEELLKQHGSHPGDFLLRTCTTMDDRSRIPFPIIVSWISPEKQFEKTSVSLDACENWSFLKKKNWSRWISTGENVDFDEHDIFQSTDHLKYSQSINEQPNRKTGVEQQKQEYEYE